jgi:hypothetical protein
MRKVFLSAVLGASIGLTTATVAPAQDAAAGEKVFTVCRACHQIGEGAKIAVGPVLNGVFGRKAGTYPGIPTRRPIRIRASPGTRIPSRPISRIRAPRSPARR